MPCPLSLSPPSLHTMPAAAAAAAAPPSTLAADVAQPHHAAFCFDTLAAHLGGRGGAPGAVEPGFEEAHW